MGRRARSESMVSGRNFIARGGVWRLAFGLAAACGSDASDSPGEGGLAGAVSAAGTDGADAAGGAGGADAGSAGGCPPPVVEITGSGYPVWAREYSSGQCCRYEDQAVAPESWPVFDSEAECEGSCRCAELESTPGAGTPPFAERISLECACGDSGIECASNPDAAATTLCSQGYTVLRSEGCGLVRVAPDVALFGQEWVFDASSSALVGVTLFSDAPNGPCRTFSTYGGVELACSDVVTCQLCGEDSAAPPCE